MSDRYTEVVSRRGLGGNIKRRFSGMIIGLILFLAAFPLLWWNEGQLKQQHEGLDWLLQHAVSIDPSEAGAATDGQPVHLIGTPQTEESLTDPLFGLSLTGLIRLKRQVEMYQWKETETTRTRDTPGGGSETIKEYSYSKVWSEDAINSSGFAKRGYDNPRMPFQSEWFDARQASFGVFRLEQNIIRLLDRTETLPLGSYQLTAPDGFAPVSDTSLYRGSGSPSSPELGDLRIQFNYVAIQPVSIIARQSGNHLTDVTTPNNLDYLLVAQGHQAAEQLVEPRRSSEEMKAWIIRGVGILMMLIGVQGIFHFIGSLLGFIPFFRGFVGGIGFLAGLMVALTLGSTTIALAWLAARPIFAIACLGLAAVTLLGGGVFGARNVRKTNRKLAHS